MPRLGRATPPGHLPAPVQPEGVGIVHLGIGAFHRAHQAVYTEHAARLTGDRRWGILGVTQRSPRVRDQLRPQGGLYTVLTADASGSSLEVIGSVVDVADPRDETPRVLAAIAAPSTHVVTLTVTEKGYTRRADGALDLTRVRPDLDALAADAGRGETLAGAAPAGSPIGLLVRGLAARHRAGGAPLTVLCCDNLTDNGRLVSRLVSEAVDAALPGDAGAGLRVWLAEAVTFPSSMVDRIVPAATEAQRAAAAVELGARDEGLVVGEPFSQWVIEDRFAGPRPAWDLVGAVLTDDVGPYERAKLRLLNGTHSLVAYAGALAGHATIADAVADPAIAEHARRYLFDDALPTLVAPAGLDLRAYGEQILERFANPHTGHTTAQVAMDGTQKIPIRWGGVLADRLAAGTVPHGVTPALAAWAVYVRERVLAGERVDDPRADELAAAVRAASAAGGDAVVRSLLALPGLLLPATLDRPGLVDEIVVRARALGWAPATAGEGAPR